MVPPTPLAVFSLLPVVLALKYLSMISFFRLLCTFVSSPFSLCFSLLFSRLFFFEFFLPFLIVLPFGLFSQINNGR